MLQFAGNGVGALCTPGIPSFEDMRKRKDLNVTVLSERPPVFVINDLISKNDSAWLVNLFEETGRASQVRGFPAGMVAITLTTQENTRFDYFVRRIAEVVQLPPGNAETLSVHLTPPGKLPRHVHHDYVLHCLLRPPGPRLWNVLALLSDIEGGATGLPLIKLKAKAPVGGAVLWANTFLYTLLPDYRTKHYGRSVASGTKVILTTMFRSAHCGGCSSEYDETEPSYDTIDVGTQVAEVWNR